MKILPRCVPQSSHTHCFKGNFFRRLAAFLSHSFQHYKTVLSPTFILSNAGNTFFHLILLLLVMMLLDLTSLVLAASLASGASIPLLQDPDVLYARQDSGDPGLQDIPSTGKADNTFSNGLADATRWPDSDATPPAVYGNRTIDLPFGRLYVRTLVFDAVLSSESTRRVSFQTFPSMSTLQSLLYAR